MKFTKTASFLANLLTCMVSIKALAKPKPFCRICGKQGNLALKHPMAYIESEKNTCVGITVKTMKETSTKIACDNAQEKYKTCCNGTPPQGAPPPRVQQIPVVQHTGPFKKCNICRNADYPTDPSHVINMLCVGAGSCRDYYEAGQQGKIPTYLCDTLRFFAHEPCGCSSYRTFQRSVESGNVPGANTATLSTAALTMITMSLHLIRKKIRHHWQA